MAIVTAVFRSERLKKTTQVCLAVPDSGPRFAQPLGAWRAVTLLHGLSEDAGAWIRHSNAERYALERGLVLVMPCADRSMYCDGVLGQDYFSYVTEELPDYLHRLCGLSRRREQNAIAGASMGGYGAARAALTRPEQYAAWGSLSGLLDLAPAAARLNDALRAEFPFLAAHLHELDTTPLNPVNLPDSLRCAGLHRAGLRGYIACGLEDDLLCCTQRYEQASRRAGLDDRFVYVPQRGHDWRFWDEQLPALFDFAAEAMA